MTDNVELNAGSGGVNLATDDDGTAHHQYVKVEFGADNTQTPVSSANPMPVDNSGQTQPVSVSSLPLPTGAATASGQLADGHNVTVDNASGAGAVNIQDGGNSITVDGAVAATNAGTFVVQEDGAALTALQLLDDTIKTLGTDTYTETSTKGSLIGAVRNDTLAALADTDNEIAPLQVNNIGAVWVDFPDAVTDSNNSTTTPLALNTDFTGTGTDLSPYAGITVSLFADQDSDANGMKFQFSSDGTNWDIAVDGGFDYLANTGRTFQFDILAKYFRIIFQNAGTNQTAIRIQTLLHHHPVTLTSIHRADDDLAPDRSCTVTKSILMAQKAGAGDFTAINSTASGNLKVSMQEISDGVDVGNGAVGSETQRVTIASDSTGQVKITDGTDTVDIFGSSGSDGEATSPKPMNTASFSYSFNGTTWDRVRGSVADGLLVNLGGNNDVTVAGVATAANQVAKATGGMSYHMLGIAAADNDAVIKASAATVYFISMQSIDATPVYLKLFDLASFTPGTSTADLQFMAPSQGDALGSGITLNFGPHGIQFTNGLCALVATGFALDNNTAVGANEVIVTIGYE